MFTKGKVQSYDANNAFGVIRLHGDNREVFFYSKDLPNQNIAPTLGENLKFLMVENDGKLQAENIVRLDLMRHLVQTENTSQDNQPTTKDSVEEVKSSQVKIMLLVISGSLLFIAVSILGYYQYQRYQVQKQQKLQQLVLQQKQIIAEQRKALGNLSDEIIVKEKREQANALKASTPVTSSSATSNQISGNYVCDGRTHCSQMRSYAEAVFFLRNCPGTQMDGNNDGEPCERQFGR